MSKYKPGDIIKTSGGCHYVVRSKVDNYCIYVHTEGLSELGYRVAKNPKTYIDTYACPTVVGNINEIKKEIEMTKLYEFKVEGETLFGVRLATNSEGKWVMETKGGKGVYAVDKSELQEVIPYSILVQPHYSKDKIHMMAEKGKYTVGEIYVMENSSGFALYRVVKVDTKTNTSHTFTPSEKIPTVGA